MSSFRPEPKDGDCGYAALLTWCGVAAVATAAVKARDVVVRLLGGSHRLR